MRVRETLSFALTHCRGGSSSIRSVYTNAPLSATVCGDYERSNTARNGECFSASQLRSSFSEGPSDRTRFNCTHHCYPVPIRSRVAPPHGAILLKDMSTGVPSRTILPDPDVAAVNSLGNFKIAADLLAFVDGGGIDLLPLSINDSAHRPP